MAENRIFDPLRGKYVAMTPEEAVRQLFIRFLTQQREFPQSHMASEYSMELNGLKRRADIVVFNRELKPVMIVECKSQDVNLLDAEVAQKTIRQALEYNSVMGVRVVVITNGSATFAFALDYSNGASAKMLDSIPSYNNLCEENGAL